jgi:hypothetical protein
MSLKIETIQQQLQSLISQRDNYSHMVQQCIGAISVLSEQLKMLELEDESNCEGENENVKTEYESQE